MELKLDGLDFDDLLGGAEEKKALPAGQYEVTVKDVQDSESSFSKGVQLEVIENKSKRTLRTWLNALDGDGAPDLIGIKKTLIAFRSFGKDAMESGYINKERGVIDTHAARVLIGKTANVTVEIDKKGYNKITRWNEGSKGTSDAAPSTSGGDSDIPF
jgi:hypothetical protein